MSYLLELRKIVGQRPLFSPGATVLALNDSGEVLMQLRADTGTWGFPGGSSELGDSLLETAKRELLEETGLTAQHYQFITVLSGAAYRYVYPNGDEIYNVAAVFVARELSGVLKADHESLELRWFARDSLPTDLAGPITQWVAANLESMLSGKRL